MTKDSLSPPPGGQARSADPLFDTPAGHCWHCQKPIDRRGRRAWRGLPGENMTHRHCETIWLDSPVVPTREEYTDEKDGTLDLDYWDDLEECIWGLHPCRREPRRSADPSLQRHLDVRIEILYARAVQELAAADNPYRLDGEDFGDYLQRRIIDAPHPFHNPKAGLGPIEDDEDDASPTGDDTP
jgi:hypothetical protein